MTAILTESKQHSARAEHLSAEAKRATENQYNAYNSEEAKTTYRPNSGYEHRTDWHHQAAVAHQQARNAHAVAAVTAHSKEDEAHHLAKAKAHHHMYASHHDADNVNEDGHHTDDDVQDNMKERHKELFKEETEMPEENMPQVNEFINKLQASDHVGAQDEFDALMNNRLDMKLTARTKELAAQVFGPGVVEEITYEEPAADDEVATDLQKLVDETWSAIQEEAGDEGVDEDAFVESFNAALAANELSEKYSLWRPQEAGFTKRGMERASSVKAREAAASAPAPKVKKVSKTRQAAMDAFKAKVRSTNYGHNERPKVEETEPTQPLVEPTETPTDAAPLTELKARTLRHYVGHAQKQIKSAQGDMKRASAKGNTAAADYFKSKIEKRKAGIKTVTGRQKAAAKKRAESAKAKVAAAEKTEKSLDKPTAKAA